MQIGDVGCLLHQESTLFIQYDSWLASEMIKCEECEKVFTRRYMKMHKQIHSELRPVLHCPQQYCPR